MTGIPLLCGFSAAFLHYFMLVFFAWTAVEATWLYVKLVKVFGTQYAEKHYIIKSGIPAWGKIWSNAACLINQRHQFFLITSC